MSEKHPLTSLDEILSSLRRKYVLKRFLEILTLALILDLSLEFLMGVTAKIGGPVFYSPFFLSILLVYLILKAVPSFRLENFAFWLDRETSFNERLFHFLQYRKAGVDAGLRKAQENETLQTLPTAKMNEAVRPRFTFLTGVLISVFFVIAVTRLTQFVPPIGPLQRQMVSMVNPKPEGGSKDAVNPAPTDKALTQEQKNQGASSDEAGDQALSEKQKDDGTDKIEENEKEQGQASNMTSTKEGMKGNAKAENKLSPRQLTSTFATEDISKPVPPRLLDEPVTKTVRGGNGNLLSLLPGSVGKGVRRGVDPAILSGLAEHSEPGNRNFLRRYYKNLINPEKVYPDEP